MQHWSVVTTITSVATQIDNRIYTMEDEAEEKSRYMSTVQ